MFKYRNAYWIHAYNHRSTAYFSFVYNYNFPFDVKECMKAIDREAFKRLNPNTLYSEDNMIEVTIQLLNIESYVTQ